MSNPRLRLVGLDWRFSDEVRQILSENNIELIEGLVEEAGLGSARFDVVLMNQLIEHLWDPKLVMSKVFSSLKPGGLLSVETVNSLGYDRAWFGNRYWGGYYWPRHLQIFSHESLARFLQGIGFSIERHVNLVAPLHWTYTLHAMTKDNPRLPRWVSGFFSDVNPLCLGFFTAIDVGAKLLGKTTTNQKMIARKP